MTMFCSSDPNIYPHTVAISWLIFIPFKEQGWKCYQQVIYYQKYFMKMHNWILSQSPLGIVILPMILMLSLNMFMSICKFSLYLLIIILCFQLGCKFIVYSNPDFLSICYVNSIGFNSSSVYWLMECSGHKSEWVEHCWVWRLEDSGITEILLWY